jgi:hypothetical protein
VSLADVLADVLAQLDRAAIPYMVTGSLASTYHGEPRATLDLDIVIEPDEEGLSRLIAGLEAAGFYVDRAAALEALRSRSQFNAIGRAATKVDFIIRKDRPFSIEEFRRRRPADLLGITGYVATVEDMVVVKLEWAVATGSGRQLRDVAGMLAVAGPSLDQAYVEHWVTALGLTDAWHRIRQVDAGQSA